MPDTHSAEPLREHQALPQAHFVYMLQCANGAFYSGYTTNVEKRIATHNAGKGAKYTRAHRPVTLLASWSFSSKGAALRAERAIKRLSHAQKVSLTEQAQHRPSSLLWIIRKLGSPHGSRNEMQRCPLPE